MGLRGEARIVGIAERPSERKFAGTPTLSLEQWAGLAADALADAGIDPADVDADPERELLCLQRRASVARRCVEETLRQGYGTVGYGEENSL